VSILKKIYVFSCLILLSGCVSSTAFLGPIFTGAKTGSVYQASISYGGNKIINKAVKLEENENFKNLKQIRVFDHFTIGCVFPTVYAVVAVGLAGAANIAFPQLFK